MKNNFYDIAVIGGGIAGLYSSLRLVRDKNHSQQSIGLFEASNYLGGRIKSYYNDNLNLPCELGCMRFLKSQKIVKNLIERHYKLSIQPFDTGSVDKHIYYLRGNHVDLSKWNVNYNLPIAHRSKSPFQILNEIINQLFVSNGIFNREYSAQEWSEIKNKLIFPYLGNLQGQKLSDIGFANFIAACTSDETLKFIADSGEYYAKTINWNAEEALPYSQTVGYKAKDDIEYWCISKGFSELVHKISEEIKTYKGSIQCQMELKEIDFCYDSHARYKLIFQDHHNHKKVTIFANKIILAIPKKPLQQVVWKHKLAKKFNTKYIKNMLNSVRSLPAIRIALLFKTPWWKQHFKGLNGHMVTDLPIRHGYYFGSLSADKYSVFLSTIDMNVTDYWLPYITQQSSLNDNVLPSLAINEIMRQLKIIHQIDDIELPAIAIYSDWSREYQEAGFHAWNPKYSVKEVMKNIRMPLKDESIHIIGESFSGIQGWAEGALCTAERLMQDHFKLDVNEPWLENNYFLGY
jgi:protoporphyrinogen oxidase